MEWWIALYRQGPPIWWMAIGLTAPGSFFGLRAHLAEQWSSAEVLSNQLPQVIIYHSYASLRGTSFLETEVVLCPHMSGLHWDRSFSFLIYYGTLLSNFSPSVEVTVLLFVCYCLACWL